MSLHGIVFAQRDSCSQNAVIDYKWRCPSIKIVLTVSVISARVDCNWKIMIWCYRAGHLNPGRYKQNKLRETLTRMAKNNKKTLPEGVSSHHMHLQ